uniref:CM0216.410.nc protein n=1 Tax=Lotus japonicus TaxID=34305 RepID=B0BLI7_LOTJA|nr:CM0216.410.nc [Lotus japonicus]
MNNSDDVKGKILRMKKFPMDLRGFPEDNITLLIQEEDESRTYTQPTEFNIRAEACHLVEHANPGDTLCFTPTGLYPVTVLKKVHMLSGLLKSIFPMRKSSIPNSCVILFNAFQGGQMKAIFPFYDIPELFFPPLGVASSTTTTPPNQHRLYGGFTTTILDILEETHGQVTNVELFQMEMEKLKMQGIRQKPGLHSNHHHHADAPFCSAD